MHSIVQRGVGNRQRINIKFVKKVLQKNLNHLRNLLKNFYSLPMKKKIVCCIAEEDYRSDTYALKKYSNLKSFTSDRIYGGEYLYIYDYEKK